MSEIFVNGKSYYPKETVRELEKKLAEMTTRKDQLLGAYELCEKLYKDSEKKLDLAIKFAGMVQDNTTMPHQHKDYYLRLCCLSERASELLAQLNE